MSDSPPDLLTPLSNAPEVSVSELSRRLRRTLEDAYGFVRVRGELGRATVAKSGHLYADLKDADSVLSIVMWKGAMSALKFRPEEGLEVVCEGKITTYAGRSNYQMVVERMSVAGQGALLAQVEERRKRLLAEGLFAAERKKPIPMMPRVIGVVTSPTGAVIRDILHRLSDRFPVQVLVWPVLVQGERAAEQVTAAIKGFDAMSPNGPVPRPELVIVARGGGSVEDLMPFNDEGVVRAAAACSIPLISAVGHETDTTLIDYAADLRAPTPTGAAEKAVPVRVDLMTRIDELEARLSSGLARGVEARATRLSGIAARLPKAEALLAPVEQRLDRAGTDLDRALLAATRTFSARLDRTAARLQRSTLEAGIARRGDRVSALGDRLRRSLETRLDKASRQVEASGRLLDTLSHQSILKRGFAMVLGPKGELVRRAGDVKSGAKITVRFTDGDLGVKAE
jgi:exodeoxyribonuclease VII large subunit